MNKSKKPRFKAGSIIKSQLPHPSSPKAGTLYYIKGIEKGEYIVCDYPSKKKPERIPFKYIDNGAYIDGVYIYNYILYKEDEDGKDSSQNSIGDKERYQQRKRQKTESEAHRDVCQEGDDQPHRRKSRTTSGSSQSRSSGRSKSRARPGRKEEKIGIRGKKRQRNSQEDL